jgi:hypothetical protein
MTRSGRRAAVSKSSGHLRAIGQSNRTLDLCCGYGNYWCPSGLLGCTTAVEDHGVISQLPFPHSEPFSATPPPSKTTAPVCFGKHREWEQILWTQDLLFAGNGKQIQTSSRL